MKTFLRQLVGLNLVTLVITLFSAGISYADMKSSTGETAEQAAIRLQEHYQQIDSLSFSFIQTTSGQMSGRAKTGKGNGVFAKTDGDTLMRWNYNSPERQVLISDGSTISMYFEKLKQMIISPVDIAQADILFSFFAGKGPLADDFLVLQADLDISEQPLEDRNDLQVIQLVPRQTQSQIRTIHLWVTADSLIRRIELMDHFDTRTIINLKDITINPLDVENSAAMDALFSFTPPEGTEIIRQ